MDTNAGRRARPHRALAWLVLAAVVASPALVGLVAEAATGAVEIAGSSFNPTTVYIQANDKVKWTNNDPWEHNITVPSKDIDVVVGRDGGTYTSGVFASGTYSYYCSIHGSSAMSGTVTTDPAPTASPSVTATITLSPTTSSAPKPKKSNTPKPGTATPTPTSTPTVTATPAPSETPTPTPSPIETLPSSTPIPTFAGGPTGSSGGGNGAALAAIVVVVLLGGAGYLIYRRFIASP